MNTLKQEVTTNSDGETRYVHIDWREMYKDELAQELATKQLETAQQCYLECLREECGEGECARAIRTKFNLKGME